MLKIGLAAVAGIAALMLTAGVASAHDGEWEGDFDGSGEGVAETVIHVDEYPWKGWFEATVTNTGDPDPEVELPWGDFHFALIRDLTDWGYPEPSEVIFDDDDFAFEMLDDQGDPWSDFSYVIAPDLLTVDFFFYDAPVFSGDEVTFRVYTDNTQNQRNFGIALWPTPVPEPATMGLLALGGLAVAMRRRRR